MTKWSNQSNLKMETPFNEYTLINEIINSHSVFVYLFHVEQKKTLWTIGEINKIIGFNPFNGSANTCEIDEQHYHPDDRNIIKSRMAFFYQTLHNKWAGVFRVKHVNGKWVWIYSQMTTLEKDNQGLPIVVSGFYINARDGLQTPIQMKDLLREFLAEDNHDKIKKLSKRETAIVKLIAQGFSYTEIASKLCIQPDTVNRHRKNILRKLELKNIAKLACLATQSGLV